MNKPGVITHFIVTILILVSFLSSCYQETNIKSGDTVFCNAEKTDKTNEHLVTQKETQLNGSTNINSDFAFNGKRSLQLDKNNPIGFVFELQNAKHDEYFQIKVWQKKDKGKGKIVIKHIDSETTICTSEIIEKDSIGWELLSMDLFIPPNFEDEYFSIYVKLIDSIPGYFDNFSITRIGTKKYPSYEQQPLRIFIDSLELYKLNIHRTKAFKHKINLNAKSKSWVEAIVFEGTAMMKATVRLSGTQIKNYTGSKLALDLKIKQKNNWHSLRDFRIIKPESQNFIKEWFAHKIYQREGILSPRYEFIPVIVNEKSKGLFAWEENTDRQFMENAQRQESAIMKFSDIALQTNLQLVGKNNMASLNKFHEASSIIPLNKKRIMKKKKLSKFFKEGQNLVFQYKNNTVSAEEIFNIKQLASYFALTDLLNAQNQLQWNYQKFYYNPHTSKIELVATNCYDAYSEYKYNEYSITGQALLNNSPAINNPALKKLFANQKFTNLYIYELKHYTSDSYIKQIMNELNEEIGLYSGLIAKEYPRYKFDSLFLHKNAKRIQKQIPKYLQQLENIEQKELAHKKELQDTTFYEQIAPYLVQAYFGSKSENQLNLNVKNFNNKNIIILGTGRNAKKINHFFHPEPKIKAYNQNLEDYTKLSTDTIARFLFFMIEGKYKTYSIQINKWKHPRNKSSRQLFASKHNNLDSIFESIDDGTIIIREGNYKIKKPIIIPDNQKLIIEAGTHLNFINNAGIISYSPVYFEGTKEKRIVFTSFDESSCGLVVLDARDTSLINYTIFENLNSLNYKNWNLSGGLTFYHSDVNFSNCRFQNCNANSTLDIFGSKFIIDKCNFVSLSADGVNLNYSIGKITNSKFYNINKDAISITGSSAGIESCTINDAGDKGISAGESSNIGIRNCKISNSKIGIASKDFTIVMAHHSTIEHCNYGILVFRKKVAYGPSSVMAFDMIFENNEIKYIIEQKSILSLNGKTIRGNVKELTKRFYK